MERSQDMQILFGITSRPSLSIRLGIHFLQQKKCAAGAAHEKRITPIATTQYFNAFTSRESRKDGEAFLPKKRLYSQFLH